MECVVEYCWMANWQKFFYLILEGRAATAFALPLTLMNRQNTSCYKRPAFRFFVMQVNHRELWHELRCSISDSDHLSFLFPFSFRRNGSIIVDYLIFTSPQYTGTIQDLQSALTQRVNNSRLGAFAVNTPVFEGKLQFNRFCRSCSETCQYQHWLQINIWITHIWTAEKDIISYHRWRHSWSSQLCTQRKQLWN